MRRICTNSDFERKRIKPTRTPRGAEYKTLSLVYFAFLCVLCG
jgi:hypothetical protein